MIRKDVEGGQFPLLVESIYDALRAAVQACGGAKEVASRLWPAKPTLDARSLLLNCLNPERHEKLDPEQVVMILKLARERGFHQAKHWLDEETGYQASAPADPTDETERLAGVIADAAETLKRATAALERIQRPAMRSAA